MSDAPSLVLPEDIATFAIKLLKNRSVLRADDCRIEWKNYESASEVINGFDIPQTTISAVMSRLLFALAYATQPAVIVGAGTYVGFAFSWLLAGAASHHSFRDAYALDIDEESSKIAGRNLASLAIDGVSVKVMDAVDWLTTNAMPISLLFIDIDSAVDRKAGYLRVLRAAERQLAPGAIILAHDPCVPRFARDFEAYHEYIRQNRRFVDPVVLPVDECGISVTSFT